MSIKYFNSIFVISFLFSGCISSLFKEAAPTFSDEITLPVLSQSFNKMNGVTYPSWKNKTTSNVISVLSDCSDSYSDLKSAHAMITNVIDNETIIDEKKTTLQNTKAYYRKVSGLVDGENIEVQSISFKYKNCIYLSSLSGSHQKLTTDIETWTSFNQKIEFKK